MRVQNLLVEELVQSGLGFRLTLGLFLLFVYRFLRFGLLELEGWDLDERKERVSLEKR